jgi:hypothetical protein
MPLLLLTLALASLAMQLVYGYSTDSQQLVSC